MAAKEEDLLEETTAVAIKRVIAYQLLEFMRTQELTKAEMARRMETSRAALDRLLDPVSEFASYHLFEPTIASLARPKAK